MNYSFFFYIVVRIFFFPHSLGCRNFYFPVIFNFFFNNNKGTKIFLNFCVVLEFQFFKLCCVAKCVDNEPISKGKIRIGMSRFFFFFFSLGMSQKERTFERLPHLVT